MACGGLLGAVLTTWVTFVPCFLWIFLGAPYIERLRHYRSVAAAMSAITGQSPARWANASLLPRLGRHSQSQRDPEDKTGYLEVPPPSSQKSAT